MPHPKTQARKTAEEFCKKYSNKGDATVAKVLYKKHPELYTNVEGARRVVRTVRGHAGKQNRQDTKDKSLYKPITNNKSAWDGFDSEIKEKAKFKLPKSIKKVLLLSDVHIPYQHNEALQAAIEYGKQEGVDCVFLNGDILDFYQVSFHERDPRKRSISHELEMGRKFFDILNEELPDAVKYYIPGNHEVRWMRWMFVKAPELLDMDEWRLDILLKLGEKKVNYLEHGTKVYFGKLLVEHGDKLKGAGGVFPARTAALKFKRSVILGHFHRTTSFPIGRYDDENKEMAFSTGHLTDPEPDYFQVNEHNHGFAIVHMLGNDEFRVDNKLIIKGKVY